MPSERTSKWALDWTGGMEAPGRVVTPGPTI
jgi:hypothetical protein